VKRDPGGDPDDPRGDGAARPFRVRASALGLRPKINFDKALGLAAELEDEEIVRKLGRVASALPTGLCQDAAVSERWQKGLDAYASQFGIAPEEVWEKMSDLVGERMAVEAIESAAGAWPDDCLDLRVRSLVVVTALIVQGGVEARLRGHVRWAVAHGATREELEALCALVAVYAGFPKASVGVEVVRDELDRLEAGS
jgi:4-carboxymuconolactone decarboxylase